LRSGLRGVDARNRHGALSALNDGFWPSQLIRSQTLLACLLPTSSFHLMVFDPPHIERKEARGFLTKKCGILTRDWREMLRREFAEWDPCVQVD
jgi:hypothetical protein